MKKQVWQPCFKTSARTLKKNSKNRKSMEKSWRIRNNFVWPKLSSTQIEGSFENHGNKFLPDAILFPSKTRCYCNLVFLIKQFVAGIFSPGNVNSSAVKRSDILCSRHWKFLSDRCKSLFRKNTTLFSWRKVSSELSAWQKETCFDYPAKNNLTKVRKMLIAKQKKVLETFNGKRVPKQSCWHAGCFDNDTVKKNLPWLRKQTARSLKIWENEAFLPELFTQTFVCTDTKQLKKISDRNINQTLRAFFTQCPRKFQEMRNFLRKKLFTRKSSGDPHCSFEKCVGKVRPEVQEKSHSKPESNWKFLTFKNRSWPIKTNLCTENRYFSKPRQRISSRQ